jgi:hypothetical protein
MTNSIHPNRKLVGSVAALVLVLAVLAVLAGSAFASSNKSTQFSVNTKVNAGVLVQGRIVNAHVKVTNPEPQVKSWWSQSSISSVVRYGVNGKYQMPYRSNGFSCSPVVRDAATSFTCTLIGADVPTIVKVTFAAPYRA